LQQLRERRPERAPLADRLVEQDDTADELIGALGGEQQLPVGPPVVLCRLHTDRVEPLLDGAVALVGGKDALARDDERLRGPVQPVLGHVMPPCSARVTPDYGASSSGA